jgi:hypothetical protein
MLLPCLVVGFAGWLPALKLAMGPGTSPDLSLHIYQTTVELGAYYDSLLSQQLHEDVRNFIFSCLSSGPL